MGGKIVWGGEKLRGDWAKRRGGGWVRGQLGEEAI